MEINVWQYWNGERTPAVKRLEKTVENLYSRANGYVYHRLTNDDLPEEIKNLFKTCRVANVTDVLRYWLIYNYGGVWFDSDVAVRKRIDFHSILKNKDIVITANVRSTKYFASPCILAGNKKCFLFKKLLDVAFPILKKNGNSIPYDLIGPKLITKIMNNHKKRWYILPHHGYKHQISGFNQSEYQDFTDMQKYSNTIYGDYWSYAHFCGGNVRWWNNNNMPAGCVLGDTVERCERDLGYKYEREL